MATSRPKVPAATVAGLVAAIVLDTFVQVAWKRAVTGLPDAGGAFGVGATVFTRPLFFAAIIGFVAQLANWLLVLKRADLSFAQPITAVSYVTVLAIAHSFLHEPVSLSRLAGVGLILVGVFFITRTPARTNAPMPDSQ